jgi:guanyl-specific ribonuclease Sa
MSAQPALGWALTAGEPAGQMTLAQFAALFKTRAVRVARYGFPFPWLGDRETWGNLEDVLPQHNASLVVVSVTSQRKAAQRGSGR